MTMNKLIKMCPHKIVLIDLFVLGVEAITHKSIEENLNFSHTELQKALEKSKEIVEILESQFKK